MRSSFTFVVKPKTTLLNQRLWLILSALVILWLTQLAGAVAAPPRQGEDLAVINSPASNAVVRGVVPIVGSADHSSFQFYIIEVSPEPITGDQWQIVGATHNTPVINEVLENWDTTQVSDGSYTIRLRTVRQDGNYSESFAQQVVVANAQPAPTDTPLPTSADQTVVTAEPTITPTPLPPTPTIVVEQPIVDTPTPRPVAPTTAPLTDPQETTSFIPTVTGFSLAPLGDACLYGAGVMLGVFLLFGFLAALRTFIQGFIDRTKKQK